jgi:hypothetical protein
MLGAISGKTISLKVFQGLAPGSLAAVFVRFVKSG